LKSSLDREVYTILELEVFCIFSKAIQKSFVFSKVFFLKNSKIGFLKLLHNFNNFDAVSNVFALVF
jgi:hypothetical protein